MDAMQQEVKVTLLVDMTEEELSRIVPSARVHVTITSVRGTFEGDGEILNVAEHDSD